MITLNGKEIELSFNMKSLRNISDSLGCPTLSEVPTKFDEMISFDGGKVDIKQVDKIIDLAALSVFHGSKTFTTLDEVMEQVTDASEIIPAAIEFITAFSQFYGIKPQGEAEAGEAVSP